MRYLIIFILLTLFGCKASRKEVISDNQKIEEYLVQALGEKVSTDLYIVHPNVCGACSNKFLIALAEGKVSDNYYLLATGAFKEENKQYVHQLKERIRFVDGNKLRRLGLSGTVPYVLKLNAGKLLSIQALEIGKY